MRLRKGDPSPESQEFETEPFAAEPSPGRSEGRSGLPSEGRFALQRPTGGPSLRARALKLLAAREHSRFELQRKLGPHAEGTAQLDALLDDLEHRGLLSVQRVVESLLHQRSAGHGSLRLRQALMAKGLQPADFQEALGRLAETELQRAQALYQRRFGGQPCTQPRDLARRQRYLLGRGFSGEVVRQVLRSAALPSQDE